MTVTYGIMAVAAVLLLIGYCSIVKIKEPWLLLLYICVSVVNIGYFLLSVSKSLEFALLSNDIVYLGSVALSMCMFLTVYRLCGFRVKKRLVVSLSVAALLMFSVIATAGFLPLYYKEVSLIFIDGTAKLEKVYGPLHPIYLVYLLSYFAAMVTCILQSVRKNMMASHKHATLIATIVFGNIAVWFVEKFIPWDFEFLSVSYLFSEVVLLALYWMMQDYIRLDSVTEQTSAQGEAVTDPALMSLEEKVAKVISTIESGESLASREREILELILQNKKRKDIASELCLSENTIKTYTRTLYSKLGVSSRDELNQLVTK